jgi:hypothetical protein
MSPFKRIAETRLTLADEPSREIKKIAKHFHYRLKRRVRWPLLLKFGRGLLFRREHELARVRFALSFIEKRSQGHKTIDRGP